MFCLIRNPFNRTGKELKLIGLVIVLSASFSTFNRTGKELKLISSSKLVTCVSYAFNRTGKELKQGLHDIHKKPIILLIEPERN